jgi:hypothetical protein
LKRLGFLSDEIREKISRQSCMMHVDSDFQTDMNGLYAVGPMAMENFGPLLRFMAGSDFASRRLTRILRRRIASNGLRVRQVSSEPPVSAPMPQSP